ncbi:hypothetical protein MMC13_005057 [Lambiella insularis]|nr:hypothetical protein [Lambiella insularis]
MSKLLTVFGSTGGQGGSVLSKSLVILSCRRYTRSAPLLVTLSKPSGEKLKSRGCEVMKGDLSDRKSLDAAVEGSDVVFAVTNYWESASKEKEVAQGKNVADAVKAAGVKVFIWSSLPHVVKHYAKSIGIPTVAFLAGLFMSGLKGMIRKASDSDAYTLAWPFPPTMPFTLFDSKNNTGKFVAGILAKPDAYIGKQIVGATDWYTPEEIIETFKAVTGKEASYLQVTEEQFKNALPGPPHVVQELFENFMLIRDYKYFGPDAEAQLKESHKVVRGKLTPLSEAIREMEPW